MRQITKVKEVSVLPADIWLTIFSYANSFDLLILIAVCRQFRHLLSDDKSWRPSCIYLLGLLGKDFDVSSIQSGSLKERVRNTLLLRSLFSKVDYYERKICMLNEKLKPKEVKLDTYAFVGAPPFFIGPQSTSVINYRQTQTIIKKPIFFSALGLKVDRMSASRKITSLIRQIEEAKRKGLYSDIQVNEIKTIFRK